MNDFCGIGCRERPSTAAECGLRIVKQGAAVHLRYKSSGR